MANIKPDKIKQLGTWSPLQKSLSYNFADVLSVSGLRPGQNDTLQLMPDWGSDVRIRINRLTVKYDSGVRGGATDKLCIIKASDKSVLMELDALAADGSALRNQEQETNSITGGTAGKELQFRDWDEPVYVAIKFATALAADIAASKDVDISVDYTVL